MCAVFTRVSARSRLFLTPGCAASSDREQRLDLLALQGLVAAGRAHAADQREAGRPRELRDHVLGDVGQRADDDVPAVVGAVARRHGPRLAGEELVQEQRLDEVVGVVAERDLGGAELVATRYRTPRRRREQSEQ